MTLAAGDCADQTAKIWDLTAGVESRSLDGHPASVVSVKYSSTSQLVYTASAYLVTVWDPRRSRCVHTLTLVCLFVLVSTTDLVFLIAACVSTFDLRVSQSLKTLLFRQYYCAQHIRGSYDNALYKSTFYYLLIYLLITDATSENFCRSVAPPSLSPLLSLLPFPSPFSLPSFISTPPPATARVWESA